MAAIPLQSVDVSSLEAIAGLQPVSIEWWDSNCRFLVVKFKHHGLIKIVRFDTLKRWEGVDMCPLDQFDDEPELKAALYEHIPFLYELLKEDGRFFGKVPLKS